MEVSRLGVKSELQLLAYTAATAMPDPSCICKLHCSLRQRWILNPLSEARDLTCILMGASLFLNLLSHNGNSRTGIFFCPSPHRPLSPLPPQWSSLRELPPPRKMSRLLSRHSLASWGYVFGHARNKTSPSPPKKTSWLLPLAQRDRTFHFCWVLHFFFFF